MISNTDYYSIPQAAKLCGVDRTTMWNWVKSGDIEAFVTPGGHHRIQRSTIERLRSSRPKTTKKIEQSPAVLVVDDDSAVRDTFSYGLARKNYRVETAADGFQAGIKILQFKPDLVLLDLFMEGIDGFEVCRTIKQNPELKSIKVLVLTGQDTPENRSRVFKEGADGYLPKTSDFKTVVKQIEYFLFNAEVTHGSRRSSPE